jgi:ribosomal protein S12 methylthiotransferase accessory factor
MIDPSRDAGGAMRSASDLGGTIREIAAKETFARLKPILPEFGITRVANITGLDTVGIPVWTVVRPLACSLSVSQGKGLTHELAMVSGIMESIEVFCAEQKQKRLTKRGLFECNRDATFISPERLVMRSDADLSSNSTVSWIKGEDLFDNSRKWIPAELFDLDFSKRRNAPVFLTTSNGIASGNTRTEATVHGLCEVVERDQASFWSVEQEGSVRAPNRRVIIQSITDPVCRPLVEKFVSAGLEIFLWYISINIDIPVFACTIADRRNNTSYPQQTTGYGCHPIATIALARALTEAAQSRLTHISGLREDLTWARYREEFLSDTGENKSALAQMSEQHEAVDFGELRFASEKTPLDMQSLLAEILKCLRRANLENAIIVDLAENKIFSVVFVCVPDLEYRTPKARTLYTPGSRMREYLEQHALSATSYDPRNR